MRKVTLFVGAWTDLGLEEFVKTAAALGYDGVELMFRGNIVDLEKTLADASCRDSVLSLLAKHNLSCYSISAASIGKCVGDEYEARTDSMAPPRFRGKPEEIRRWAIDAMMTTPTAAKLLGCDIVHSFLGSPIWRYFYPYPRRPEGMVAEGYARIAELWKPILDEFQRQGVRLAFEAHPSEIAYDSYTTSALIDALGGHPAFRLNFDPSHLLWQGVDPVLFVRDFADRIVHMHVKDARVRLDGRSSILASHLDFGDRRRGWDFRSPGHGQVPFEEIFRELNAAGYRGPLSVEWEDNGMERVAGAADALAFVRRTCFEAAGRSFDEQPKYAE